MVRRSNTTTVITAVDIGRDTVVVSKFVAVVIALGYWIAIVVSEGGVTADALKGFLVLLLPLGLIWFPEEIGSYTGYVSRGSTIDTETPPALVAFMGWLFLMGIPVVACCLG